MCLLAKKSDFNEKKCLELFKNAVTFRPMCFGHGCGDGVSVNNVQKEVGRVVVGLAEITLNKGHSNQFELKKEHFEMCLILNIYI